MQPQKTNWTQKQLPDWTLGAVTLCAAVGLVALGIWHFMFVVPNSGTLVNEKYVEFRKSAVDTQTKFDNRLLVFSEKPTTICNAVTDTETVSGQKPIFSDVKQFDGRTYYPVAEFGSSPIDIKPGQLDCTETDEILVDTDGAGDAKKPILIMAIVVIVIAVPIGIVTIVKNRKGSSDR